MNKTLTASIGGSVFNIEEAAYFRLERYIESVRAYFFNEEGTDEIISDIELRLSELFTEKLSGQKQVITESDVAEVIAVMGEPEQFGTEDEDAPSDKKYERSKNFRSGKRLFRDPDDRVFFGVCGGISAYFGWDPIILRVIFVTSFLFFGTGLLLYLILALIIPKAKTTAQKLQMRGEPVTVENISKTVNDSFRDLKDDIKDFGKKNDINEERLKRESARAGAFFAKLGDFLVNLFILAGTLLAKIIGVAVLLLAITAVLLLISAFLGWDFAFRLSDGDLFLDDHLRNLSAALFASETHRMVFVWALAGLTLIPFVLLLIAGIQLLFGIKKIPGRPGAALGILWFLSLATVAVSGAKLYREFHYRADYTETEELPVESDTLFVNVPAQEDPNYRFRTGFGTDGVFFHGIVTFPGIDSTHILYTGKNKLTVAMAEKSEVYKTDIERSSRGFSRKNALDNARQIHTAHRVASDSLIIHPYFALSKEQKIRAQAVTYTLRVPVGKHIALAPGTEQILHDVPNITNTYDADMAGHIWIMTRNGLACETCIPAGGTDPTETTETP